MSLETTLSVLDSGENITEIFSKNPFGENFQDKTTPVTLKDSESGCGIYLGAQWAKPNKGGPNLITKTQEDAQNTPSEKTKKITAQKARKIKAASAKRDREEAESIKAANECGPIIYTPLEQGKRF